MGGIGARSAKILVLAGLALAVSASSGTAANRAHEPILGVVPHAGAPRQFALPGATGSLNSGGNLFLQESPCSPAGSPLPCWTMRTNTTYAVYWIPSGFSVDANYESLVDRYLQDVAAASGSLTNVYSVATQYYDNSAAIHYQSTFGGSYVDTTAFPRPSHCDDGLDPVCLTDADIQAEILRVLALEGWQAGPDSLFVVLTPDGVGSCTDRTGTECTTTEFCAYHNSFLAGNGEPVLTGPGIINKANAAKVAALAAKGTR